jgi:hypothetical protein
MDVGDEIILPSSLTCAVVALVADLDQDIVQVPHRIEHLPDRGELACIDGVVPLAHV